MTQDDLDLELGSRPRLHRRERVMAGIGALGLLTIIFVVTNAFMAVRSLEGELRVSDETTGAFVDVQRGFSHIQLAIATSGRLDDPSVEREMALTGRQVGIAGSRLDRPETPQQLHGEVAGVVDLFDQLVTVVATDPTATEEAAAVAAEAERFAKVAADRNETDRRDVLINQLARARAIVTRTAAATLLALLLSGALLIGVRRRYLHGYDAAYEVARVRAQWLAESNEELQAANNTKERFISMVSHELRTPLTVVHGIAETLLDHGEKLSPERRAELAATIVRQSDRQARLINDLLLAARHADHGPTPAASAFNVADLVARVVIDLTAKDAKIVVRPPDEPSLLWADRGHLEQVLENLLTNAHKYGGPTVVIAWETVDGHVRLTVEDDGDGIDEDYAQSMFEPFSQGEARKLTPTSGVGLGLAITRTLVTANGGVIDYRPREGGGSVFEVLLPCDPEGVVPGQSSSASA